MPQPGRVALALHPRAYRRGGECSRRGSHGAPRGRRGPGPTCSSVANHERARNLLQVCRAACAPRPGAAGRRYDIRRPQRSGRPTRRTRPLGRTQLQHQPAAAGQPGVPAARHRTGGAAGTPPVPGAGAAGRRRRDHGLPGARVLVRAGGGRGGVRAGQRRDQRAPGGRLGEPATPRGCWSYCSSPRGCGYGGNAPARPGRRPNNAPGSAPERSRTRSGFGSRGNCTTSSPTTSR